MSIRIRHRILTGRIGRDACQVMGRPEIGQDDVRGTTVHTYKVRDHPDAEAREVDILFQHTVEPFLDDVVPDSEDEGDAALILGLCHIAQVLEDPTMAFETWETGVVTSTFWRSLRELPRANEAEIGKYMSSKSAAKNRFGEDGTTLVTFDRVDQLVLGDVGDEGFKRVAAKNPQYWEPASSTAPWFRLQPKLLHDWPDGSGSSGAQTPLFKAHEFLEEGRYEGPRDYYAKALNYLEDDPANAIKEAVHAVESMGKVITGKDDARFSQVCDALETARLLHPALSSALESLYGYASQEEGVRHPSSNPATQDKAAAAFVVNTAASALLMLREVDPGR